MRRCRRRVLKFELHQHLPWLHQRQLCQSQSQQQASHLPLQRDAPGAGRESIELDLQLNKCRGGVAVKSKQPLVCYYAAKRCSYQPWALAAAHLPRA